MRKESRAAALVMVLISVSPWLAAARGKRRLWVSTLAKSTEIAGAKRVGSAVCAGCHAKVADNFRHSFHAEQGVRCEDCHGPGSLHVESGGNVKKIISLRLVSAGQANAVCLACHERNAQVRNWYAGPHAANGVRCIDCHTIHAPRAQTPEQPRLNATALGPPTFVRNMVPESAVMLESREQMDNACLRCHPQQRAEMSLPYHHPLREGKMTCVDCHNPHGGPAGNNLRKANVNELCLSCHAQYRGPYMYQHPPVTESCLICHSAHGSPNSNLLTVSQPALCLQCHTGHHDGAGLPLVDRCTDCHGSIHGSDVPTPSGGSRFVDKGGLGVPGFSQPTTTEDLRAVSEPWMLAPVAAHAQMASVNAWTHPAVTSWASGLAVPAIPSHVPNGAQLLANAGAMVGGWMAGFPTAMAGSSSVPNDYWALYFTPGAYRFLDVTGYGGRVGEYDSLRSVEGGNFQGDYVSVAHHLSLLTRATVEAGSDFDFRSQFNVGHRFEFDAGLRSFVQQQENYPFYSSVISPDIGTTETIPPGLDFGIVRRLGTWKARLKVPKLPVHVFVRGDWQARVGQTQLAYLDENIDTTCSTCHYTSRLQSVNYTTRDIGGGVEVSLGSADLTYEHDFSSFHDRLPFPSANFGPFENEDEHLAPVPLSALPDTPAGTYYLDIPAPSQYSADSLELNWIPSPKLVYNGQVTYQRGRDVFTNNPQKALNATSTLSWHPQSRVRITANYRQQNLLNDFVPYFPLYGNVSYHEHWAGLKLDYKLRRNLDVETLYERNGITRSNAFLWPQIYSPDNTDPLQVVPASFSNTEGLILRYHRGGKWRARVGYQWTGTHAPGYVTVPMSNNRAFGDVVLVPARWLTFTNDTSIIIQNAFPVIRRRNRFYNEAADATLVFGPPWKLDLGYSYQQDDLATYMALQNDPTVGYVLDEPWVPYHQLSQTYWIRSAYRYKQRMGLSLKLEHNAAHSGMLPDLNPNDYLLMGNGPLVEQGAFDPIAFGEALDALELGSTKGSQVEVGQWIGQGRIDYLLPYRFRSGFLLYYGSYSDRINPSLSGILRGYTIFFGRTW